MIATKEWVKDLLTKVLKKQANNYSFTEEQKIGTWVDGKPLYQKAVYFESLAVSTDKSVTVYHNIENVDTIWVYDGFVRQKGSEGGQALNYPSPWNSGSCWVFGATRTYVSNTAGADRSGFEAYVIIRYTKTTD